MAARRSLSPLQSQTYNDEEMAIFGHPDMGNARSETALATEPVQGGWDPPYDKPQDGSIQNGEKLQNEEDLQGQDELQDEENLDTEDIIAKQKRVRAKLELMYDTLSGLSIGDTTEQTRKSRLKLVFISQQQKQAVREIDDLKRSADDAIVEARQAREDAQQQRDDAVVKMKALKDAQLENNESTGVLDFAKDILRNSEVHGDNERLSKRVSQVEKQYTELYNERTKEKADHQVLLQANETLQSEKDDLSRQVAQLEKDKEDLERRNNDFNQQCHKLREENARLVGAARGDHRDKRAANASGATRQPVTPDNSYGAAFFRSSHGRSTDDSRGKTAETGSRLAQVSHRASASSDPFQMTYRSRLPAPTPAFQGSPPAKRAAVQDVRSSSVPSQMLPPFRVPPPIPGFHGSAQVNRAAGQEAREKLAFTGSVPRGAARDATADETKKRKRQLKTASPVTRGIDDLLSILSVQSPDGRLVKADTVPQAVKDTLAPLLEPLMTPTGWWELLNGRTRKETCAYVKVYKQTPPKNALCRCKDQKRLHVRLNNAEKDIHPVSSRPQDAQWDERRFWISE